MQQVKGTGTVTKPRTNTGRSKELAELPGVLTVLRLYHRQEIYHKYKATVLHLILALSFFLKRT